MISKSDLSKKVAKSMIIYPYKDRYDDKGELENPLPTYTNDKGEEVSLSEHWREVGFEVPWPTVKIMSRLTQAGAQNWWKDEGVTIKTDPDNLAQYITQNLIKSWIGIDGEYDRKWMYEQMSLSSWLIAWFRTSYEEASEKWQRRKKEEDEDFKKKSDESSASTLTDTGERLIETSANESND